MPKFSRRCFDDARQCRFLRAHLKWARSLLDVAPTGYFGHSLKERRMTDTTFNSGSSATRGSTTPGSGLGDFKQQAGEFAHKAADRVDATRQPIADKLHGAAGAIRDQAQGLATGEGLVGVAKTAADKLESSASYIESHNTKQMIQDVVGIVKRHPAQSLLIAGAVGFLFARAFRSE
jgi:hypothetical protein